MFDRSPSSVRIDFGVRTELHSFSEEKRTAEIKYKIIISSRIGQISLTGTAVLEAEDEKELREVKKIARKETEIPPQIAQIIVLNLQPLLLHIEKEMGMPIVPFTVPEPKTLREQSTMRPPASLYL